VAGAGHGSGHLILRLLAFLAWCAAWLGVVWAMLDPAPPPVGGLSDKVIHFLSFVAVSLATVTFCRTLRQFVLAGLWCVLAGIGLEVAQRLTATRRFEWADMAANLSGTAVGIVLAVLLLLVLQGRWQAGRRRAGRRRSPSDRSARGASRPARRPV
jgi:VanZ family protein